MDLASRTLGPVAIAEAIRRRPGWQRRAHPAVAAVCSTTEAEAEQDTAGQWWCRRPHKQVRKSLTTHCRADTTQRSPSRAAPARPTRARCKSFVSDSELASAALCAGQVCGAHDELPNQSSFQERAQASWAVASFEINELKSGREKAASARNSTSCDEICDTEQRHVHRPHSSIWWLVRAASRPSSCHQFDASSCNLQRSAGGSYFTKDVQVESRPGENGAGTKVDSRKCFKQALRRRHRSADWLVAANRVAYGCGLTGGGALAAEQATQTALAAAATSSQTTVGDQAQQHTPIHNTYALKEATFKSANQLNELHHHHRRELTSIKGKPTQYSTKSFGGATTRAQTTSTRNKFIEATKQTLAGDVARVSSLSQHNESACLIQTSASTVPLCPNRLSVVRDGAPHASNPTRQLHEAASLAANSLGLATVGSGGVLRVATAARDHYEHVGGVSAVSRCQIGARPIELVSCRLSVAPAPAPAASAPEPQYVTIGVQSPPRPAQSSDRATAKRVTLAIKLAPHLKSNKREHQHTASTFSSPAIVNIGCVEIAQHERQSANRFDCAFAASTEAGLDVLWPQIGVSQSASFPAANARALRRQSQKCSTIKCAGPTNQSVSLSAQRVYRTNHRQQCSQTACEEQHAKQRLWRQLSNLTRGVAEQRKLNGAHWIAPEVAKYIARQQKCAPQACDDNLGIARSLSAQCDTYTGATMTRQTASSDHMQQQQHQRPICDKTNKPQSAQQQHYQPQQQLAMTSAQRPAGETLQTVDCNQQEASASIVGARMTLLSHFTPPAYLPSSPGVGAAPFASRSIATTAIVTPSSNIRTTLTTTIPVAPSSCVGTVVASSSNSGGGGGALIGLPTDHAGDHDDVSSLSSCILSQSSSTSEVRLRWSKKMDFLLSIIGFAVDLANIWRFPYLVYKNGGGVFLIPYVIMLVFGGIPLFFLELCLGQFVKKGPITVWNKICPTMKGVGYCSIMISWYVSFYYNVLIAWSVYFIYRSLTSLGGKMPWQDCDNEWNNNTCVSISYLKEICATRNETIESCRKSMFSGTNSTNVTSPASDFFVKELSQIDQSTGLDDMGHLRLEIVLCAVVVYLLHYFSLFRGLETSGKVVWVTATAPYMILSILLVRGLFLPGAWLGIEYYLSPNMDRLTDPNVWIDAAIQVFYSIGVGFGVHLTFASFNTHNNNCHRDCLITAAVNAITSVYSGLVVFVYLGYMATNLGIEIDKVANEGYGLVFEVYPEALTTLPFARFWSILFFIMLLTLGIDSAMGGLEAVITGLEDEFKFARRLSRAQLTGLVVVSSFLPALISCTQGGAYTLFWFDIYSAGMSLLFSALFETIGVVYCYGIDKFIVNIESMLGHKPHLFYILCWKYVSPIFLIAVIVMNIITATVPVYRNYVFPQWSVILGWCLAFSSVAAVPIVAIYTCCSKNHRAKSASPEKMSRKTTSRTESSASKKRSPAHHLYQPQALYKSAASV